MTTRPRWMASALVGAALALALTVSAKTKDGKAPAAGTAATLGDEEISIAELEARAAIELADLDTRRHRVLERALTRMIGQRLLDREAARRGVTVQAMLRAEVRSKAQPITEAEVEAFIAQKVRPAPREDQALRRHVAEHLEGLQLDKLMEAFVTGLRAQTPVQVYLEPAESPRVRIDPDPGFARGPREAPVTIVEFSDFQCPHCRNVVSTLEQLMRAHPDRLRWVFRDFPIPTLHPEATLAHEAARCAGEQGKFWAYHDRLFERAPDVSLAALRKYATELNLDAALFGQCLDNRSQRAAVSADIEAGKKLGVTSTPTFFINGLPLVGNQPLAEFQRVVERELGRTRQ